MRSQRLLASLSGPTAEAGSTVAYPEHVAVWGRLPQRPPGWLGAEATSVGLTGRGGAAFPTGRKLAAVARARGRPAVVANGMEGEPASRKDLTLLLRAPHLVLDGLQAVAADLGADTAILAVKRGSPAARALGGVLGTALAERRDRVPVEVAWAPSRYVASQETALLRWLSGAEAKPAVVPPRPAQRGLSGRPTLLSNVETFAHLARLARVGAAGFAELGSASAPGTFLLTVTGAVRRPGVVEVAGGTPLPDVLAAAGGASEPAQAVLLGGYFGRWLPMGEIETATVDPTALRARGATLGAGVVLLLAEASCGLAETARVVRWLAAQSAGQCGPCRVGLPALSREVDRLAAGTIDEESLRRLDRWTRDLLQRGACHHPDGTALFVASALRAFRADVDSHLFRGRCRTVGGQPPTLPIPASLHGDGGWR
ncbi:MAG: NADH-ubiquinone oxidoreductase-F iron-sulfur binding region domain-containing protein [Mycobacteriales bacterium]